MILLQGNAAREKNGMSMFRVGKDTPYGSYDLGYRKKSFGMDTAGTSASSQKNSSSFLLCLPG